MHGCWSRTCRSPSDFVSTTSAVAFPSTRFARQGPLGALHGKVSKNLGGTLDRPATASGLPATAALPSCPTVSRPSRVFENSAGRAQARRRDPGKDLLRPGSLRVSRLAGGLALAEVPRLVKKSPAGAGLSMETRENLRLVRPHRIRGAGRTRGLGRPGRPGRLSRAVRADSETSPCELSPSTRRTSRLLRPRRASRLLRPRRASRLLGTRRTGRLLRPRRTSRLRSARRSRRLLSPRRASRFRRPARNEPSRSTRADRADIALRELRARNAGLLPTLETRISDMSLPVAALIFAF